MTELRRRMIRDMTVRGLSPRTQKTYLYYVRRLAKHYLRPPDELSAEEVQEYISHMVTKHSWSWNTCSIVVNALRFFYHTTMGREAMEFVVPMPKQSKHLPEILSREEVRRLIESPPNPKHRLLLATIYAAGLRVSEALKLRVRDIDKRRMTIHVRQGKGRKDRMLPLPRKLLDQMKRYWHEDPPGEWLFRSRRTDGPLDVSTAQKMYLMAKLRAGITKDGGIHSLRHAYATHMIEDGTEIPVVQRMLGHRCVSTTMRYFHLSRTRLNAVSSPLDGLDHLQP